MLPALRRTVQTLGSSPWLSLAAVVSLALGIGANTAIFGLLHALLMEPLPLPRADRLLALYTHDESAAGGPFGAGLPLSHPNFEDLRDDNRSLSHLAGWITTPVAVAAGGGEAEQVPALLVSGAYFPMLEVEAGRGRYFSPAEVESAAPVAVLGHGYWQRRFGGDPAVVGTTVRVNGSPFQVVGVMPETFTGTSRLFTPSLWLPLSHHDGLLSGPLRDFFASRRGLVLEAAGRLAPGVSRARAEQELAALGRRLAELHPEANRDRGISVTGLAEAAVPAPLRQVLTVAGGLLLAVSALVLAVACANVAQLLLVRATARRREVALRLALGEGKGRLLRSLFLEGGAVAALGGGAGLLLAWAGGELLWRRRPPMLSGANLDLTPDAAVVAFATVLALGTALVFALVPARQVLRTDLTSSLALRDQREGPGRRWGLGRLMVGAQAGLCVVALAGCGLFLGSLHRLQQVDPGFDVERTASFAFDPALAGHDREAGRQLLRRAVEEAAALPGVESASLGSHLPLGGVPGVFRTIFREGVDGAAGGTGTMVTTDAVGAGYFETLGVPLLAGRGFTGADREDAPLVAVVNRTMSERLWPEGGALGRRFTLSGDERPRTVVGVAQDSLYTTPGADPEPFLYLPLEQQPGGRVRLFLRTPGDPSQVLAAAQQRVRELEPGLPLTDAAGMSEVAERSLWAPRFAAVLLGAFAFLALALAAIGVYGVVSYRVARRRREIGVRMALGADRGSVLGGVVRRGMGPVAAGVVAGLLLAALLGRTIRGVLYGIGAADPVVLTSAAAVLLAVALAACFLPARRATRLDPAAALRPE